MDKRERIQRAPERAWFDLILEDVVHDKECWTCYEVGIEKGDIDGVEYVRADIVKNMFEALKAAKARLEAAHRRLGLNKSVQKWPELAMVEEAIAEVESQ